MKILLIRPPYVVPKNSVTGNRGVPPLGITYLSSALKSDGHHVECLDAFAEAMDLFTPIDDTHFLVNGLNIDSILDRISPDVALLGISCMFSNEWISTSRIIRAIKKRFPQIMIVLGGEHVTADSEYILKNFPEVNFCILGEGEEKLKNLARHLKAGERDYSKIEGISYLDPESKTIKTNAFSYRIKDINEIKPPDWDSIPLAKFLDRGFGFSMRDKRSLPMLLSRGCPYRCTFCSNESMWTTKWIPRDLDAVIAEMKLYQAKYNIEHIDFFDLTAVVNRNWTIAFCKRMIQENLGLTWALPSGTRSEALDFEVLSLLKQSGCTKITYAPETGSAIMSKKIKKNVNLQNMLSSMRHAVKLGLIVKANIIFGFPDERYRDILWNFVFMAKMAWVGVHDVPCFGFSPYPGSALFKRLLQEGKIKQDENYDLFLADIVYTNPLDRKSWSPKLPDFMLPLLSLGGMAFFYSVQYLLRPWRFAKLIRQIYRNQPHTMMEIAFSNIIDDFWKGRRQASPEIAI